MTLTLTQVQSEPKVTGYVPPPVLLYFTTYVRTGGYFP